MNKTASGHHEMARTPKKMNGTPEPPVETVLDDISLYSKSEDNTNK